MAKLQINPPKNYNFDSPNAAGPKAPKYSSVLWTNNIITFDNTFYLDIIIMENANFQKNLNNFLWL